MNKISNFVSSEFPIDVSRPERALFGRFQHRQTIKIAPGNHCKARYVLLSPKLPRLSKNKPKKSTKNPSNPFG